VAVGYWNEVARFTQTAFVIAIAVQVCCGMNGGHCKPVESTPHNAQKVTFRPMCGSHGGVDEGSSAAGCDAVQQGECLPTFRRKTRCTLKGLVE
jgi:hypothetical protein